MKALFVANVLLAAMLAAPAALADEPAGGAAIQPPPPALAGTLPAAKAARIDKLFADLKAAPADDAKPIERAIINEWMDSGDAKTDEIMRAALFAMNRHMYDVALRYLDTIVVTRPDYIEGWNKRATVYYLAGRYDESLADIAHTLSLDPRHFGALTGLGMIFIERGDKAHALSAFEQALAVDPVLHNGQALVDELKRDLGKGI
jgi:tetratricopeptide (TPR) repeat protein